MNALDAVRKAVLEHLPAGGFAIDATAGRGGDTVFLARTVGETGRVLAFDIQEEAVESTRARLKAEGLTNARGDHSVYTRADSTCRAITAGLGLLRRGGLMCVTVYSGGANGYDERDALLPFLASLDDSRYQVLVLSFHNWKKDPPLPVFVTKL